MARGERHADFEWRQGIETNSQINNVVDFQKVLKDSQQRVTFEILDTRRKELLSLHQKIGNNWQQELLHEKTIEKKNFFGKKKQEKILEVDEKVRATYYSYFYKIHLMLKTYKEELFQEKVDENSDSILKLNKVLVQLKELLKYLNSGHTNPQNIMKYFPQLISSYSTFTQIENLRIQEVGKKKAA